TRLTSKTTSVIQNNLWTHVAGTYNSATNLFSIYINGALDTTTTVPSAAPSSGTDSLYIGYDAGSGGYFSGMIDEARVWNRALSEAEISRNLRTSLTASGGAYDGLIVSVPFQGAAISTDFTVLDQSVSGFDAVNNGAVSVDFGNRPPTYLSWNESAEFDGTGDYLAAANSNAVSPTAAYTLEAWIYPRSFDNSPTIIGKNFQSGFWLGIDSTASTGKIVLFIPKGGAVPSFTSLPLTNQ
ncbi:MAG: laminin G domain-containing protein, partial [Rhizobacter sp.]|nr:laminin G domain-containing protein [Chlorobiales bacterium]